MRMLRRQVEERLSAMLGGEVQCRELDVSPLKGVVDARGVSVRFGDGPEPAVEVRRVKLTFSLGGVLHKSLTVTSAVLERPVLRINRAGDARINLPVPARQRDAAEQPRAWSLDLRRALVVDGEVWFHGDGFEIAATGVLAELARDGDGYRFTLIVESPLRGTAGAALGEAKLSGRFSGAEDVTRVAHAPLSASGQVGNSLHFTVNSPSLSSGVARVDARGTIDLSQLSSMLRRALPHGLDGHARIEAAVVRTPASGWKCESLNLSARDVSLVNGGS